MITLLPNVNTNQSFYITPKGSVSSYKLYDRDELVSSGSMAYLVEGNLINVFMAYSMYANYTYNLFVYDSLNNEVWRGVVSTYSRTEKILQNEFITL